MGSGTPELPDDLRAYLADDRRPAGTGRMLPGSAYTSAAVLDWELEHVFAGGWVCLGRGRELADGRTHRTTRVGRVGVLLTFAGSGPRAFANVCRHRAHELLPEGDGSAKPAVVCPYHGWSYRLDGALLAAPGFHDVEGFDPVAYGLVSLPLADWHGWLFVNADAKARAFEEHVGALADLLAPYHAGTLALGARHDYEVAANWKIITENFHECYHCPLIHPELCRVSPPASGHNFDLPGEWVGGVMDLRDGADTMSLDGASRGAPIDGLAGGQLHTVLYVGLYPDLLVSAHPDYVMTHRMDPLGPDRTRVECSWYFPAAVTERPGFDPAYAVDFWDLTNRQDWAACESVQRGVSSPHYRPGPLGPTEDAVGRFVAMGAAAYLGATG
ncbi:MAG: aromatic ring-hydroxylating dioxygenase subunit alpha [Actinomycetota bacterium]|nr:aromatic ring-hydroxylating dioxygenase subunit alpha [Actinomycetota bacterium]